MVKNADSDLCLQVKVVLRAHFYSAFHCLVHRFPGLCDQNYRSIHIEYMGTFWAAFDRLNQVRILG